MRASDFEDGLAELRDYYGDNAFSGKMASILFRILGELSRSEFGRIIEMLVEEHPRTPSIASIKRAALPFLRAAEQRRQQERLEQLENLGQTCQVCGHTGYVLALLRSDPTKEFSFRCPACPASKVRRIDQKIREWSDELKPEFIPVSLKYESHAAARDLQKEAFAKHAPKRLEREGKIEVVNDELAAMGSALLKEVGIVGG